jgi:hypothetical protein
MAALSRKTTIRGRPMKPLDLNVMCDICNHDKCSKKRQAEAAERRARENE